MKFAYYVYYVPIIILRSTVVVQNTADFTLEELTHISRELSPLECMRLLEAIYLAIPDKKGRTVVRETPLKSWIPKESCLNELKSWNHQFSDKTELKPRAVMIQHLNALGRTDLANYVRKNREPLPVVNNAGGEFREKSEKNYRQDTKIPEDRVSKRDADEIRVDRIRHYPYPKQVDHGVKRGQIPGRTDQYKYNDIRHPVFAAIFGGAMRSVGQAPGPSKSQPGKLKYGISEDSLFLITALGVVVVFICGIVFLIFRRLLKSSSCPGERSGLISPRTDITQEKGLQCIRCFEDHEDCETRSNRASQISEIDVEGGSFCNSAEVDGRTSCSNTVSYSERITPRVSIEELKLSEEEEPSTHRIMKGARSPNSSRCRPLEPRICGPNKPKKKKKKTKVKCHKEENRTTKNYLKAMQQKILPRQHRKPKKECRFDTKQLQDKILTILNEECGVCRCCNCNSHWEVAGSKDDNESARDEKAPAKPDKKQSKRDKREKLSTAKGGDKEVVIYQASVTSRSPMSGRRSTRKQESDSGNNSNRKSKKREKSGRFVSFRVKKAKDKRVLPSSSSETDEDDYNDNEIQKKYKSKRSKRMNSSANNLLSAHDKPKRFF